MNTSFLFLFSTEPNALIEALNGLVIQCRMNQDRSFNDSHLVWHLKLEGEMYDGDIRVMLKCMEKMHGNNETRKHLEKTFPVLIMGPIRFSGCCLR